MGVAKKEIFNTQFKQIFRPTGCNSAAFFVFGAFRDKVCLFLGGGGEESVFNILSSHSFFPLLLSFFTACFVAHFIVFPLCGVFGWLPFQERKGKE